MYLIFVMVGVTWQRDERRRLDAAKEQLESIKYHPLRDYTPTSGRVDERGIKRKKLRKEHINCEALISFFVSVRHVSYVGEHVYYYYVASLCVCVCNLNNFSASKLNHFSFFLLCVIN